MDYVNKPLEKPLKLVLKVGGSEVTELSGSGHDSSYYDDRSDYERERHKEKKKKKKKKSEKEKDKHVGDEERRRRKSGKLVTKMFQKIQQLIDDKDSLVFVLIDEVESLTAARSASRAGTEPSDAIRVVNSVLTQLDQIKRNPNVVILTTSNVTEKIDLAFVDRADIKQYIGPPSPAAIFKIYLSCLDELMKCQIIYPRQQLLTLRELEMLGFLENKVSELSLLLNKIAQKSKGLSGRALRKLPFLAHALYIQVLFTFYLIILHFFV
ncbi:UNVERIFIED_CONTAM: hypothetical protein FKN15_061060 [Acipenser sinensis]